MDAEGLTIFDFSTKITSDTHLYASWKKDAVYFTVTIDLNYEGAPAPLTYEVESGKSFSFETYPTREDYSYMGMFKEKECLNRYYSGAIIEDTTFYISWLHDVKVVTFDYNYYGAPEDGKAEFVTGKSVPRPTDPTREGYSFEGWYIDEECSTLFDFSSKISVSITLYAKWSVVLPKKFSRVSGRTTLFVLSEDGHLFAAGWNYHGSFCKPSDYISRSTLEFNPILPQYRFSKVEETIEATIALTTDGKVFTWGSLGFLGDGSEYGYDDYASAPSQIFAGFSVADIGVSTYSSYVILTNGDVYSFGANTNFLLGLGGGSTLLFLLQSHKTQESSFPHSYCKRDW